MKVFALIVALLATNVHALEPVGSYGPIPCFKQEEMSAYLKDHNQRLEMGIADDNPIVVTSDGVVGGAFLVYKNSVCVLGVGPVVFPGMLKAEK